MSIKVIFLTSFTFLTLKINLQFSFVLMKNSSINYIVGKVKNPVFYYLVINFDPFEFLR